MTVAFRPAGDLFSSDAQALVNTVNCVGIMGKGVALEFRKRFPLMFDDYVARCERGEVRIGEPYLYADTLLPPWIVNFPTKQHWRGGSQLAFIEKGLAYLGDHVEGWGIESLAVPPLGCGQGGLQWSEVRPLIDATFTALPIDVEVFAPD